MKPMSKPATIKPRRKFDLAFKEEAVQLWLTSGRSARVVAGELGINENSLHNWKARFAPAPPGGGGGAGAKRTLAQAEAEIAALRREADNLRQQRDILKKTLGILSEPPPSATGASRK